MIEIPSKNLESIISPIAANILAPKPISPISVSGTVGKIGADGVSPGLGIVSIVDSEPGPNSGESAEVGPEIGPGAGLGGVGLGEIGAEAKVVKECSLLIVGGEACEITR